jgi:drug/metabolite transporter (DMT)-like permease
VKSQTKAYLCAGLTVMLWSTVATAFKLSLRHLDPIQLLLYASLTSTLVLGLTLALSGKAGLLRRVTPRQHALSVLMGALNPCLYYLVLFKAYDLLPAQEAQPLNYTWALTLAFLSIPLLGQRIGWRTLAAGVVCYGGVLVIATHGDPLALHFSDPLGVGLALGSTLIWALYWILNTRDDRDPVAGLFLNFLYGTPMVAAACGLFSSFAWPDGRGLLGAAYVGTFEMGLTFVLWLTALKNSRNTAQVANLIFLSPFVSLIFIRLFVGEAIRPSTVAGLVLIVAGLLLQRTDREGRPGTGTSQEAAP